MKYASILICVLLVGCAFCRSTFVTVDGKNIKSPYATGDGVVVYNATTCCGVLKDMPWQR